MERAIQQGNREMLWILKPALTNGSNCRDMSSKNLKYLSSQQALADLAYFIEAKKKEFNLAGNKWIVFGGSYPGSLAAWFRLKYPHLAYGAVSSSAPLLAKINFKGWFENWWHFLNFFLRKFGFLRFSEYLGVVTDSLETSEQGPLCTGAIREATHELEQHLLESTCCQGTEKLLRLCDPLDSSSELDVANLFENLAGNFEGVVQYNKDNRLSSKGANITVDVLCDVMTDKTIGSPLDRYAHVNSMLLDVSGEKCLDFKYTKFLKDMKSVSWNSTSSEGGMSNIYLFNTVLIVSLNYCRTSMDLPDVHRIRLLPVFRSGQTTLRKAFSNRFLSSTVWWYLWY